MKIYADLPSPSKIPVASDTSSIQGILVSVCMHILVLGAVVYFSPQLHSKLESTPIIQAQMLLPTPHVSPDTPPEIHKQEVLRAEPTQPLSQDSEPKSVPADKADIELAVEQAPEQNAESVIKQTPEDLSTVQPNVGFIVQEKNTTTNLFSTLPSGTQEALEQLTLQEQEKIGLLGASNYTKALISPALMPGPKALTDEERTRRIIQKSKIKVDCSSAINQVIAVVSQFTVPAVLCQQNGDFQKFIDRRLKKEKH